MATMTAPQINSMKMEPSATTSFDFDPVYSANVGNDTGISTVGFRSGKFNIPEWHESNYVKYYQAFTDRDNAEKVGHAAKDTILETQAITDKTQADSTKRLNERLHDIHFWKYELEREINDIIAETDIVVAQKRRLENALRATEVPLHIATDNLNCRNRRQGTDLVQDNVELNLLKEVEVINKVQDLLKRTIKEAEAQIKRNRERKQELEMDWSDKKEAKDIDTFAANLKNGMTCKQFHPGSAKFQEIQSTPESWAQFSHDNVTRAEHERMASVQLRTLIENISRDTARDMREQADAVEIAYQKRLEEVQDAKNKLQENLKLVCESIAKTERDIADLKKAIKDKEDPMKVAQTRLHVREYRPGVDQCRDPAQYSLINEVQELAKSVDSLMQKLNLAEGALKDLQENRMTLEKEIANKTNTIFIDKEKCLTHRTRYPSATKLQGYQ